MAPHETVVIGPNDILIAVMGITGSGKSTFVQQFTKCNIKIGHGLESCTADIEIIPCSLSDGTKFYLMDTPGFDYVSKSDSDILRDICNLLNLLDLSKKPLAGIIYLHRILNPRFPGHVIRNLRLFKKLCGRDDFARIVLATTTWYEVDQKAAERNENQIETSSDFWGLMIKRGSSVFGLDRGEGSAAKVIEYLISCREK